jgi:hypothetical protein
VIKNRTHFFGAYEGTRIRQANIYNSPVPSPAQRNGDFTATGRTIRDPLTGQPRSLGTPAAKKLRASKSSLRRNSQALAWY